MPSVIIAGGQIVRYCKIIDCAKQFTEQYTTEPFKHYFVFFIGLELID